MHYSREKRCQRTKIQRLIKYATTNVFITEMVILHKYVYLLLLLLLTYGETLLDKTNSVRTCVTYGRMPNGLTELMISMGQ